MSVVDVDSDTLRTGGERLTEQRDTLATEGNAHLLHGVGEHRHISTAGFYTGVMAQTYLSGHYDRVGAMFENLKLDLTGLSSALHLVADLYTNQDLAAVFEFAFVNPDAAIPPNLPYYVDSKDTLHGLREEWAEEARPEGGGPGQQAGADGSEGGDTQQRRYIPAGEHGPGRWVTETLNSDGEVVRAKYQVIYPSGVSHYYTEVPGENGPVQSDHVFVGPQNAPVGENEVFNWVIADQTEAMEEQLQQFGLTAEEAEEFRREGGN